MRLLTPKITGTKQIVIDTNAMVAQVDEHDKWHEKVGGISAKLTEFGYKPVYLDCVINETVSVLARRTEE